MSLTTPNDLLLTAQSAGYAVPAFNANCLEMIAPLISAAEKEQAPLIIQISRRFLMHATTESIAAVTHAIAKKTQVPITLHLDHGTGEEQAKCCLKAGFTSIMYDGSSLPFTDNVEKTRQVVNVCSMFRIPTEGEVGIVPIMKGEDYKKPENELTSVEEAVEFVRETGVFSLAVAVGNVHGMRTKEARVDFKRIEEIRKAVKVPLVIHGSSGISDADLQRAIACGICKVNIATEFSGVFVKSLYAQYREKPGELYPMEIISPAQTAVEELARERIRVLGASGRYV